MTLDQLAMLRAGQTVYVGNKPIKVARVMRRNSPAPYLVLADGREVSYAAAALHSLPLPG